MLFEKVYVEVSARFDREGHIYPVALRWETGEVFRIDRITEVRRAAGLRAGGCGTRYTVRIGHHLTFLFLENNRWFVECRSD